MGNKLIELHMLPQYVIGMKKTLMHLTDGTQISSTRKAGMFMHKLARTIVPTDSSNLKRSIGVRFKKKESRVFAGQTNRDGWDYSFFVDNQVKATPARLWFYQTKPNRLTGYRGRQNEGFWTAAKRATEKEFKDIIIRDISNYEIIK
jgi:hypothetical protein